MALYSRYLFNKVFLGFIAFITIFISLIWFSRAVSFVKYITENGVELSKFFYLFALILPWLLLFIIPVSLFAAILVIYNRLIANNEITILKNSGLNKFKICKPVILIAIIASLFCFTISFFFMPYANKQLRLSRQDFQNNYASLAFNPKTFETLKNLTIYTRNRDENNQLSGILLHDERSLKYSVTITAKQGNIKYEDNSVLLYMKDGTVQKFNYENNKSEILNFDNYVFNLTENKRIAKAKRWKAKERYLNELIHPNDDSEPDDLAKYRMELHQRFTYPLLPLAFSIIALTWILHGNFNRRGNLNNIIFAIATGTIFLGLVIVSYDLIEMSAKLIPFLYMNFFIVFAVGLQILNDNYKHK